MDLDEDLIVARNWPLGFLELKFVGWLYLAWTIALIGSPGQVSDCGGRVVRASARPNPSLGFDALGRGRATCAGIRACAWPKIEQWLTGAGAVVEGPGTRPMGSRLTVSSFAQHPCGGAARPGLLHSKSPSWPGPLSKIPRSVRGSEWLGGAFPVHVSKPRCGTLQGQAHECVWGRKVSMWARLIKNERQRKNQSHEHDEDHEGYVEFVLADRLRGFEVLRLDIDELL
jgi:hypothetical protein